MHLWYIHPVAISSSPSSSLIRHYFSFSISSILHRTLESLHSLGLNPGVSLCLKPHSHMRLYPSPHFKPNEIMHKRFSHLLCHFFLSGVWFSPTILMKKKNVWNFFQTDFFSRPLVFRNGFNAPNIIISQMLVFLVWSWSGYGKLENIMIRLFCSKPIPFVFETLIYALTESIWQTCGNERALSLFFVYRIDFILPSGKCRWVLLNL